MKKIFVLMVIMVFCLYGYTEEKEMEITLDITSRITEIEKRIDKIDADMTKIQEEIKKIKESINQLLKVVRELQIYTQGGASIKPDEEVWKSVKRGMSVEEVEKLLGTPEEIEQLRTGGEVWYYYGLGSISFDRNGIVVSQQTFKRLPVERRVR